MEKGVQVGKQQDNKNNKKIGLLIIRAVTPLHVGVGSGEFVDLSIQRDEFGFPVIWGTSLKGALKAQLLLLAEKKKDENVKKKIYELLGSDPGEQESSRIKILDARSFLIPARTLKSIWTYATSKHMIDRLIPYLELAGIAVGGNNSTRVQFSGDISVITNRKDLLENLSESDNKIYGSISLNEYFQLKAEVVNRQADNKWKYWEFELIDKTLDSVNELKKLVDERGICILDDRDSISKSIINRSMVIQYRIRLDKEKKTVSSGGLWSEELLPSETIMVSLIAGEEEGDLKEFKDDVLNKLLSGEKFYLTVGGKESVGRGLAKVYLIS